MWIPIPGKIVFISTYETRLWMTLLSWRNIWVFRLASAILYQHLHWMSHHTPLQILPYDLSAPGNWLYQSIQPANQKEIRTQTVFAPHADAGFTFNQKFVGFFASCPDNHISKSCWVPGSHFWILELWPCFLGQYSSKDPISKSFWKWGLYWNIDLQSMTPFF